VIKRSCFTSARKHLGASGVWTRDVADCYPSITPQALFRELKAVGFKVFTARLLTNLFTVRGQIPQGSPLSGHAVNLFMWRQDQRHSSEAGTLSLAYTRVADDIVVSGRKNARGELLIRSVETELQKRGLRVNLVKKAKNGFQDGGSERLVHNISVARRCGTKVSKAHWAKVIGLANAFVPACKSISPDSICAVAYKRRQLAGWMHYCRQAQQSPAKHVRRQLEAGDRTVIRKLRALGISVKKNKWWLSLGDIDEPRRIAVLWRRRLFRLVK
jgi:hypothetical protein